jgi:dipeptidyl aminopeptidase/acylaminoacyl peptidase
VLLTGSNADDWISEEQTRQTARVLEGMGAEVRLRIYEGRPHVVTGDEMGEARELLREMVNQ